MPDPPAAFETWRLHRVAHAVEAGEVSADLLADIHAAMAATYARPPEARHALALMELAERVNLPVDRLTELLATLEAQPPTVRERFLRRFVEAWLIQQREAYEPEQHGGDDE
jgi:HAMP domain-containing protein